MRLAQGACVSAAARAVGVAAPPGRALELQLVLSGEARAHAFAAVAVAEEEITRGALLGADRIAQPGVDLAAAASAPEHLAAGLQLPASSVAELADLEGAALIDAEPPGAPAAARAAHELTSLRPPYATTRDRASVTWQG